MPNIQIHGLRRIEGHELAEKIFKTIKKEDPALAKDAVVEMCDTRVVDENLEEQPFLRICSSDSDHLDHLVKMLKPLGYDIETLKLEGFYPKE